MQNSNHQGKRQRAIPVVTPYPRASRICSRHGSKVTDQGERKVYARNTFMTCDPQEKVLQYYSQQFGQPSQQQDSLHWQQETTDSHQHVLLELTVENEGGQAGQTLIKSCCVVTLIPQAE